MFSEWDGTPWAGSEMKQLSVPDEDLATFVARLSPTASSRIRPWRRASVAKALGVPAIQRAVTLISNTTGALTVQAFRNSAVMDQAPAIVSRPDPYSTPRDFYRDSAYNLATRGECVWWIASRTDGQPAALIVVPLAELDVQANAGNRLMPRYVWGDPKKSPITGTRYSPVNRTGDFVHITYLKEPGALRGSGPLQLGGAAVSVSVEAQEWAANFYGDGGHPSLLIKHAGELSPERLDPDTFEPDDDNGLNEADRLRSQWMDKPHNVPRVIDQNIESVEYMSPNEGAAQGLKSRDFQTGEAARLYGMPGALLEYGVAGASLTYQNLADVWLNFVRGCLAPNYLEPIEQAMTDLLPRTTVSRFLTSGLYRADAKTRWEIYQIMVSVLGPDRAAELAEIGEDLAPGNPETAPIPMFVPSAPVSIPRAASVAMRDVRCPTCKRLVARAAGRIEGWCRHCKRPVADGELAAPEPVRELVASLPAPAPNQVTIADGAIRVSVPPPDMTLVAEAIRSIQPLQPAPVSIVNQIPGEKGLLDEGGPVAAALTSIAETQQTVVDNVIALREKPPLRRVIERDKAGRIIGMHEETA